MVNISTRLGGPSSSLVNICAQSVHDVPADGPRAPVLNLRSSPSVRMHTSQKPKSPCSAVPPPRPRPAAAGEQGVRSPHFCSATRWNSFLIGARVEKSDWPRRTLFSHPPTRRVLARHQSETTPFGANPPQVVTLHSLASQFRSISAGNLSIRVLLASGAL